MASASLDSWIDSLQAAGRYYLLHAEAVRETGLSPGTVSKALHEYSKSGRLAKLKEYFYVIVPLEYRAAGAPPASWFIHDLMAAMKLPYYVGLLNAAALHGALRQQPQVFQVVTNRSGRPLDAAGSHIQFFTSKYAFAAATMEMKTPTGTMRVSSPETTAIDLVRYAKSAGHLNHVATVISKLAPLLDSKRMLAAARAAEDIPNVQRLGYVLDTLRHRRLSEPIHKWVVQSALRVQPLRRGRPVENAARNERWAVMINGPIEIEA